MGIARWQVAQTAPAVFVARFLPTRGQDSATVEAQVRAAIEGLIGPGTEVAIEFPAVLERTANGKVLSFIPWTPRFGRPSGPLRIEE